jgi:hypothetical protein
MDAWASEFLLERDIVEQRLDALRFEFLDDTPRGARSLI